MDVKSSVEARQEFQKLLHEMKTMQYNPDINRLVNNLDPMIKAISLAEVDARRTKSAKVLQESLKRFNDSADYVAKMLLVVKLTQ